MEACEKLQSCVKKSRSLAQCSLVYLRLDSSFLLGPFLFSLDKLTRLDCSGGNLARLDAVKHRWSHASALLTLLVAEIERFTDGKLHFAELALRSCRVSRRHALDLVLLSRTSPADRTAVVLLVINRNASFDDAVCVAQVDAAVDFIAARILFDACRVAEVFRAVAFVAVLARVHPLAFVIWFAFEHACGQLFHFII